MPRATNAIDDGVECTEAVVDERASRLVVVVTVDARDGGRVVTDAAVEEWSPTGGNVLGVCCAPTAGGGAVAAVVGTGVGGAVLGVCCAPTGGEVPVTGVGRVVVATVVGGAVAGGGAGTQTALALAGPRGGGSVGSPAPSGCQRQPSTIAESTRDAPGPKFE